MENQNNAIDNQKIIDEKLRKAEVFQAAAEKEAAEAQEMISRQRHEKMAKLDATPSHCRIRFTETDAVNGIAHLQGDEITIPASDKEAYFATGHVVLVEPKGSWLKKIRIHQQKDPFAERPSAIVSTTVEKKTYIDKKFLNIPAPAFAIAGMIAGGAICYALPAYTEIGSMVIAGFTIGLVGMGVMNLPEGSPTGQVQVQVEKEKKPREDKAPKSIDTKFERQEATRASEPAPTIHNLGKYCMDCGCPEVGKFCRDCGAASPDYIPSGKEEAPSRAKEIASRSFFGGQAAKVKDRLGILPNEVKEEQGIENEGPEQKVAIIRRPIIFMGLGAIGLASTFLPALMPALVSSQMGLGIATITLSAFMGMLLNGRGDNKYELAGIEKR